MKNIDTTCMIYILSFIDIETLYSCIKLNKKFHKLILNKNVEYYILCNQYNIFKGKNLGTYMSYNLCKETIKSISKSFGPNHNLNYLWLIQNTNIDDKKYTWYPKVKIPIDTWWDYYYRYMFNIIPSKPGIYKIWIRIKQTDKLYPDTIYTISYDNQNYNIKSEIFNGRNIWTDICIGITTTSIPQQVTISWDHPHLPKLINDKHGNIFTFAFLTPTTNTNFIPEVIPL